MAERGNIRPDDHTSAGSTSELARVPTSDTRIHLVESIGPVRPAQRIALVDVLRGLALLGILIANVRGFNAPEPSYWGYNINEIFGSNSSWIAQAVEQVGFQGKFITLFSFLFGIGFAIQISRAEQRGSDLAFYSRRLWILMGFGLLHAWLVWWGDILFTYGAIGFLLFAFRRAKTKTLVIWSAALLLVPPLVNTGFYIATLIGHPPPPESIDRKLIDQCMRVFGDGTYLEAVRLRFRIFLEEYASPNSFYLTILILPRFLMGLLVWRSGLLSDPERYTPLIKRIGAWSLAAAVLCDAVDVYCKFVLKFRVDHWTTTAFVRMWFVQTSMLATAAAFAAGVFLLYRKAMLKTWMAPFAAVGRMALTNYLLQSIVLTAFFRISHLYGRVTPEVDLVCGIVFFALQIPFSVWWLNRYYFGPFEWLWRSMTYLRWQPMRRAEVPVALATSEVTV